MDIHMLLADARPSPRLEPQQSAYQSPVNISHSGHEPVDSALRTPFSRESAKDASYKHHNLKLSSGDSNKDHPTRDSPSRNPDGPAEKGCWWSSVRNEFDFGKTSNKATAAAIETELLDLDNVESTPTSSRESVRRVAIDSTDTPLSPSYDGSSVCSSTTLPTMGVMTTSPSLELMPNFLGEVPSVPWQYEGSWKKRKAPDEHHRNDRDNDDGKYLEANEGNKRQRHSVLPQISSQHGPKSYLACPFYKLDPVKHNGCLKFALKSIAAIRAHIQRSHVSYNNLYCPICRCTFETPQDCEAHILGCSRITVTELTQTEFLGLAHLPRAGSISKAWYQIWDRIVKGMSDRPSSPFLDLGQSTTFFNHNNEWMLRDKLPSVLQSLHIRLEPSVASSLIDKIVGICEEASLASAQGFFDDADKFREPAAQGSTEQINENNFPGPAPDPLNELPAFRAEDQYVKDAAPKHAQGEGLGLSNNEPQEKEKLAMVALAPVPQAHQLENTGPPGTVTRTKLELDKRPPQPLGTPQFGLLMRDDHFKSRSYLVADADSDLKMVCPFFRFHLGRHLECASFSARSFPHVLQHLSRKHTLRCYCPNCCRTFESDVIRDSHVAAATCQTYSGPPLGFKPGEFENMVEATRNYSATNAEKWYSLWDILYPDFPRPQNVFHNPEWPLEWLLAVLQCFFDEVHALRPTVAGAYHFMLGTTYDTGSFNHLCAQIMTFAKNMYYNTPAPPTWFKAPPAGTTSGPTASS